LGAAVEAPDKCLTFVVDAYAKQPPAAAWLSDSLNEYVKTFTFP
jgi:hypothetical protein